MEAASFTAWLMLSSKGYKKSFAQYLTAIGLKGGDTKRVTKDEKENAVKTMASLIDRLKIGASGVRS